MPSIKHLCSFFLACILSAFLSLPVFADFVSEETAIDMVEGWLDERNERLGESFGYVIKEIIPFEDQDGEVIYYVVYIEPTGYVIVSADDLIEPIIAFTDKGVYEPDKNNPLYALLSRDMQERMDVARYTAFEYRTMGLRKSNVLHQSAMRSQRKWKRLQGNFYPGESDPAREGESSISDTYIFPFIQSEWSQTTAGGKICYNYYTPSKFPCGCVATAMAQAMRYHQHPASAIGMITKTITVTSVTQTATTRGGDGSGGAYTWSSMPLKPGSDVSDYQRQMIGALCRDAGVCVSMTYTASGSSASLEDAAVALKNDFNYSNAIYYGYYASPGITSTKFLPMLNTNLKSYLPVILGIDRAGGGHAVISDGYGKDSGSWYHHLNMGWEGTDDAWYNLPDIDCTPPAYTSIGNIVFNIFPDKTGEIISGRVVNSYGDPVPWRIVSARAQGGGTTYTDATDSNGYFGIVGVPSNTTFNLTIDTATLSNITTGMSSVTSCGNYDGADITYTPPTPGSEIFDTPYLYAADLNSDGQTDIIYIDLRGYVYYTLNLRDWVQIGEDRFTMVVAGDFNSDSNENDLAGINLDQYCDYTTDLSSWTKSGKNKFKSIISFDEDGDTVKDDLVGINNNSYCIYTTVITADWEKSGANKFTQVIDVDLSSAGTKGDLAGVNLNQYCIYTTAITANWKKSGANRFTSIITADLTDSGAETDLAGVNLMQYCIYTTAITANWKKSGANKFSSIVSADFDGDSTKDDMAGINRNQYIIYSDNATGSGGWVRHGTYKFSSVVCGDFNGDGAEDDLAAVDLSNHVLYAIRSDNDTKFLEDWVTITKP